MGLKGAAARRKPLLEITKEALYAISYSDFLKGYWRRVGVSPFSKEQGLSSELVVDRDQRPPEVQKGKKVKIAGQLLGGEQILKAMENQGGKSTEKRS